MKKRRIGGIRAPQCFAESALGEFALSTISSIVGGTRVPTIRSLIRSEKRILRNLHDTFNNLHFNMRNRKMCSLFTGDLFLMDGRSKLIIRQRRHVFDHWSKRRTSDLQASQSSAGTTGMSTMRSEIHSCGIAFTVSTVCSGICRTTRFRTIQERILFKGTQL